MSEQDQNLHSTQQGQAITTAEPVNNAANIDNSVNTQYGRKQRVVLFVCPPGLLLLSFIIQRLLIGDRTVLIIISGVLEVLAAGCLAVGYTAQTRTIPKNIHQRSLYRLLLPLASAILVTLAVVMANIRAESVFGPQEYGQAIPDWVGVLLGVDLALVIVYLSAVGNEIVIATHYKNQAILVLRKVIYAIGWVVVVAASFGIYSIVYTLDNPSTD